MHITFQIFSVECILTLLQKIFSVECILTLLQKLSVEHNLLFIEIILALKVYQSWFYITKLYILKQNSLKLLLKFV